MLAKATRMWKERAGRAMQKGHDIKDEECSPRSKSRIQELLVVGCRANRAIKSLG